MTLAQNAYIKEIRARVDAVENDTAPPSTFTFYEPNGKREVSNLGLAEVHFQRKALGDVKFLLELLEGKK